MTDDHFSRTGNVIYQFARGTKMVNEDGEDLYARGQPVTIRSTGSTAATNGRYVTAAKRTEEA